MPRHSKKSEAISADTSAIDNRATATKKMKSGKKMDVPDAGKASKGPQATSVPGAVHIIHDVMKAGRGISGVPGIISSTTLGNEVRQRLMTGIIDSPAGARESAVGPVQRAMGMDSTAYNAGMAHIAGSPYR